MPELTGRCPMCEAELTVTHLRCQRCGTGLEGTFHLNKFDRLSRDQLRFVDVFMKNRGVIRDVERELGISYPTVRSRLDEVIRALGHEAGSDVTAATAATAAAGAGGATGPTGSAAAGVATDGPAGEPTMAGQVSPQRRRQVLDQLAAGQITAEQAIQLLRGSSVEAEGATT